MDSEDAEKRRVTQSAQNKMRQRQSEIDELWFKGFRKATDIVEKTAFPLLFVKKRLTFLKKSLTPKTQAGLQYEKNKILEEIALVQRLGWEIAEDTKKDGKAIALSAGRLVVSVLDLKAKVSGVVQEKLVRSPGEEASKLLSDIRKLEQESKTPREESKSQESKEDGKKEMPLPDFLKAIEER